MKNSKILLLFAMVILSIVSCTKENIEGLEIIDPIINNPILETSNNPLTAQVSSDEEGELDLGCFVIQTPFELTVDGVVSTIETPEDFDAALINAAENAAIDFVYPISITYEDGETAIIADGMELGEAFSVCIPDDGWNEFEGGFPAFVINAENSCYDLVYPLTLTNLDDQATPITVANESAFIDALADNQILFFNFPLSLVNDAGEIVIAEDDEILFGLFLDCQGTHPPCDSVAFGFGSIGCYDVVFPINVLTINSDGNTTTVTLESEDDFSNALLNGNIIGFDFPITLSKEEGEEVVINNEEEFEAALSTCFVFGGELDFLTIQFIGEDSTMGERECYTIQFPMTLVSPDGLIVEASDAQGALEVTLMNELNVTPLYPVDVLLIADGSTLTLENEDDLINLLSDCQ